MPDIRTVRLAKVLVDYSLAVKAGDNFIIHAPASAYPLIKEVYRLAVNRGANVEVLMIPPELNRLFMSKASDAQLLRTPFLKRVAMESFNKYLRIFDGVNTREMTHVPDESIKKQAIGLKKIREKFFERVSRGDVKWCGALFPTEPDAQEASMSLEEYEDFVYDACLCSNSDPIKRWKEVSKKQAKIASKMNKYRKIEIVGDGTHISFNVEGRRWMNCDGRENMPDGEIYTSPVENSAEGHIRFSFPGTYLGKEIEDIRLQFKKGKVVSAKAAKGEDLLNKLLQTDSGAGYVGELAIGTNYGIKAFTRNMTFDEKIGGTIHIAMGAGFPEAGSKNKSTIHWDMLCDMRKNAHILADGKFIYKNGKFA